MRASPTKSIASSASGEPFILVVPANAEIEATCAYARSSPDQELVEETERLMTAAPVLTIGVDFGNAPDESTVAIFKQRGDTLDFIYIAPGGKAGDMTSSMVAQLKAFASSLPPPLMAHQSKGLKPGELLPGVGMRSFGLKSGIRELVGTALHKQAQERQLIEATEREMLGQEIPLMGVDYRSLELRLMDQMTLGDCAGFPRADSTQPLCDGVHGPAPKGRTR